MAREPDRGLVMQVWESRVLERKPTIQISDDLHISQRQVENYLTERWLASRGLLAIRDQVESQISNSSGIFYCVSAACPPIPDEPTWLINPWQREPVSFQITPSLDGVKAPIYTGEVTASGVFVQAHENFSGVIGNCT